jgi:hypothetical protein
MAHQGALAFRPAGRHGRIGAHILAKAWNCGLTAQVSYVLF